jgi:hypothetical protein
VGDGLAGNHLEPAVPAGTLRSGVHEAAVDANDDRHVGAGQLFPVGLAAGDEALLLGAEFVFQALGDGLGVQADAGGV